MLEWTGNVLRGVGRYPQLRHGRAECVRLGFRVVFFRRRMPTFCASECVRLGFRGVIFGLCYATGEMWRYLVL